MKPESSRGSPTPRSRNCLFCWSVAQRHCCILSPSLCKNSAKSLLPTAHLALCPRVIEIRSPHLFLLVRHNAFSKNYTNDLALLQNLLSFGYVTGKNGSFRISEFSSRRVMQNICARHRRVRIFLFVNPAAMHTDSPRPGYRLLGVSGWWATIEFGSRIASLMRIFRYEHSKSIIIWRLNDTW